MGAEGGARRGQSPTLGQDPSGGARRRAYPKEPLTTPFLVRGPGWVHIVLMTRFLISWAPAAVWAAVLIFLSSQSDFPAAVRFPLNDKVVHFGMFAALGAALAWGGWRSTSLSGRRAAQGVAGSPGSPSAPPSNKALPYHILLFVLGAVFAASDEWHQSFVPGRDPSAGDFVADLMGIVAGYVVVQALRRWREVRG